MQTKSLSAEAASIRRKLIFLLIVFNAIAAAWQAQNLLEIRHAHETRSQVASRNMAQALDQSISVSVEKIDVGLLSCVDFLENQLKSPHPASVAEVNAMFQKQESRLPEVMGIRAADADGVVKFGVAAGPHPMATWSDRDFFTQLKANPGAGLVVSNPVIGKVTKDWVVAFVRRFNRPDGSFAGVVAASIPVAHFERLLSTMDVGEHGIAVLRDANLGMVARYPKDLGINSKIGAKVFSQELRNAIESGEKVVTYHAVKTSDNVERINTYRRLSAVPYHLLAGNGTQDYLKDFSREVFFAATQLLFFFFVSAAAAVAIWRAFQRTLQVSERNQALLRGSSDALHVIDAHGSLVEASDSFFALLGYDRSEAPRLNARRWNAGIPSADLALQQTALLQSGKSTYLTRYRRKDGSEFTAEVSVLPLDMQGKQLLCSSFRDVTERVEAQKQLRDLNERLEARVAERTSELTCALHAAELANQSKGVFLANTSHEIRTPLNSVLGMTHLALLRATDPKQRDYLAKIQRSGTHLMRIIDDILDLSKMDAEKLALEYALFDLDETLDRVIQLMAERALDKNLVLRLDKGSNLPVMVLGDHVRVEQILLNFLSNAIKFTDRGSVVLRVKLLEASEKQCTLAFELVDSGIGLSEEQMGRLFRSFEQADQSTTRRFGGTGLGLAISRQLAHLMGGSVGVSSTPGQGCTFWFHATFPVENEGAQAPVNALGRNFDVGILRGRSILVVDDNEFNLEVSTGLLENVGIHVGTALNGVLALEALQVRAYDCILMDVQMPLMDGVETTRRIRCDPLYAKQIIIAMTANAGRADAEDFLRAGMDDVIQKPVNPQKFYQTLCQWLRADGSHPEPTLPLMAPDVAGLEPGQPMAFDSIAAWDPSALPRLLGDSPAAQARLSARYLLTGRATLAELEEAIGTGDWKKAGEIGHRFKSSSCSAGAMRLGALCAALEAQGQAGSATECRILATRIAEAFAFIETLLASAVA